MVCKHGWIVAWDQQAESRGEEGLYPPFLRGIEEWGDLGKSLGKSLGTGYQSERNKVLGLGNIMREVTLYQAL